MRESRKHPRLPHSLREAFHVEPRTYAGATAEEFAESLVAHWELLRQLSEADCGLMNGIARLLLAMAELTEDEFIDRAWRYEAHLDA